MYNQLLNEVLTQLKQEDPAYLAKLEETFEIPDDLDQLFKDDLVYISICLNDNKDELKHRLAEIPQNLVNQIS